MVPPRLELELAQGRDPAGPWDSTRWLRGGLWPVERMKVPKRAALLIGHFSGAPSRAPKGLYRDDFGATAAAAAPERPSKAPATELKAPEPMAASTSADRGPLPFFLLIRLFEDAGVGAKMLITDPCAGTPG
jgi:hypothetical protein